MYSLHSIKFLVFEKKYFYNFPIEFNAITLPYSGSHVEFSIDTQKKRHLSEKIRIIQKYFFSKLTLCQISSEMVTINIKKTTLSTRRNPNFIKIWKYDYFRNKSQRHEVVCSNFILKWQPIRFSISTKKKLTSGRAPSKFTLRVRVKVMVLNATFNNISVISVYWWRKPE